MSNLPRGIRNNNPGNVRLGISWEGLADQIDGVTDPDFCQFIDAPHGIRVIGKIIASYAARGVVTIREIIDTWAPPVENDTGAYVAAVAASMGVAPDTVVTPGLRTLLVAAIIMHENGQQPYDLPVIDGALALV